MILIGYGVQIQFFGLSNALAVEEVFFLSILKLLPCLIFRFRLKPQT